MKRLIVALTIAVISAHSNANLIDNGTYFSDTNTGLDWLKFTSSSSTGGWTGANESQVFQLASDTIYDFSMSGCMTTTYSDSCLYGWGFNGGASQDTFSQGFNFITLLGGKVSYDTGYAPTPNVSASVGGYYIGGTYSSYRQAFGISAYHEPSYGYAVSFQPVNYTGPMNGYFQVRNTLVQSSVPVPSSLVLMLSGLTLMGSMRKRRNSMRT